MSTIELPITLDEEAWKLAKGLVDTILEMKPALEDGVDWGDIPEAVAAVTSHLVPVLSEVGDLGESWRESPAELVLAFAYAGLYFYNEAQKDEPE